MLPVMYFVYGGAYYSGTQIKMDAERLAEVQDVIVVAVNYRVGPIGKFLSLSSPNPRRSGILQPFLNNPCSMEVVLVI